MLNRSTPRRAVESKSDQTTRRYAPKQLPLNFGSQGNWLELVSVLRAVFRRRHLKHSAVRISSELSELEE